jgi:hypothetical protein
VSKVYLNKRFMMDYLLADLRYSKFLNFTDMKSSIGMAAALKEIFLELFGIYNYNYCYLAILGLPAL